MICVSCIAAIYILFRVRSLVISRCICSSFIESGFVLAMFIVRSPFPILISAFRSLLYVGCFLLFSFFAFRSLSGPFLCAVFFVFWLFGGSTFLHEWHFLFLAASSLLLWYMLSFFFVGVLVFCLFSVACCSQLLLLFLARFCIFALLRVSLFACIFVFRLLGSGAPLLGFGFIIVADRALCGT